MLLHLLGVSILYPQLRILEIKCSSLSFMQEFAGIHLGGDQLANVGDGLGT